VVVARDNKQNYFDGNTPTAKILDTYSEELSIRNINTSKQTQRTLIMRT